MTRGEIVAAVRRAQRETRSLFCFLCLGKSPSAEEVLGPSGSHQTLKVYVGLATMKTRKLYFPTEPITHCEPGGVLLSPNGIS